MYHLARLTPLAEGPTISNLCMTRQIQKDQIQSPQLLHGILYSIQVGVMFKEDVRPLDKTVNIFLRMIYVSRDPALAL